MKRRLVIFSLLMVSLLIVGCNRRSDNHKELVNDIDIVDSTSETKVEKENKESSKKEIENKKTEDVETKIENKVSKETNNQTKDNSDIKQESAKKNDVKVESNKTIDKPSTNTSPNSPKSSNVAKPKTSTENVNVPKEATKTNSVDVAPSPSKPVEIKQTNEDLIQQLEGEKKIETICIAQTSGYPSEESAYGAAIDEIANYESTHEGVRGSCGTQQHFDDFGHSYWTYWVNYK